MPGSNPEVARSLRRSLRRLVVATVAVYLFLAAIAIKATVESQQTNAALCALKGDLEARVSQSDNFLKTHPNGFAGIPASAIKVGVESEERTIRALHILSC